MIFCTFISHHGNSKAADLQNVNSTLPGHHLNQPEVCHLSYIFLQFSSSLWEIEVFLSYHTFSTIYVSKYKIQLSSFSLKTIFYYNSFHINIQRKGIVRSYMKRNKNMCTHMKRGQKF